MLTIVRKESYVLPLSAKTVKLESRARIYPAAGGPIKSCFTPGDVSIDMTALKPAVTTAFGLQIGPVNWLSGVGFGSQRYHSLAPSATNKACSWSPKL